MLEASIIDSADEMSTLQLNDLDNAGINSKEICERKYQLFEKAIQKHQQKIIYLSSKQGEILIKLKDFCG